MTRKLILWTLAVVMLSVTGLQAMAADAMGSSLLEPVT